MDTTPTTTIAPTPSKPVKQSSGARTAGRIAGGIGATLGVLVALAGVAIIVAFGFARDGDGYFTTGEEPIESAGYAITTDDLDFGTGPADAVPEAASVDFRVDAESSNGEPLFVGFARTTDAERYLGGVQRSVVVDFGDNGAPQYTQESGRAPAGPPRAQTFWLESAEGTGQQRIEHGLDSGRFTVVAMNANGSRGVAADVEGGAKIDWLIWVGVGLALFGGLVALGSGFGMRQVGRSS